MGRAEHQSIDRRQIARYQRHRITRGCRLNCQLFRLRLVESRQGRPARIPEQHDFGAALGAKPFDAGTQILDCSLHQQHEIIVHIAVV